MCTAKANSTSGSSIECTPVLNTASDTGGMSVKDMLMGKPDNWMESEHLSQYSDNYKRHVAAVD